MRKAGIWFQLVMLFTLKRNITLKSKALVTSPQGFSVHYTQQTKVLDRSIKTLIWKNWEDIPINISTTTNMGSFKMQCIILHRNKSQLWHAVYMIQMDQVIQTLETTYFLLLFWNMVAKGWEILTLQRYNIFLYYQAKLYTRFQCLLYAQFSGFKCHLADEKRHWPITGLFSESAFILGCSTSVEVHALSCLSMHKSDTMVDIPAAKVDIEALPICAYNTKQAMCPGHIFFTGYFSRFWAKGKLSRWAFGSQLYWCL